MQALAAAVLAARCVRDAGGTNDTSGLAAARALDLTTAHGQFRLDPATGGHVGYSVLAVQWQGGRRVVIEPADLATQRVPLWYRVRPIGR